MDQESIFTLIWLAMGILLVASELFLPGMVAVFLGAAAMAVSLLRWAGMLSGWSESFFAWMLLSISMVIGLRGVVQRWFRPEESRNNTDEDLAAFGQVVEVVEDCHENEDAPPTGRIRFQGSTWPAFSAQGTVPKGERARLVYRDNLTWVIEAVDEKLLANENESLVAVPMTSSSSSSNLKQSNEA